VDRHAGLHVRRRSEGFRALHGDRRIACDQRGCDAAERLNAEGERRHVHQYDVTHFAGEHTRLDRGAARNAFHRVHTDLGLALENFLEESAHDRHPCWTAHEDDLLDVPRLDARVVQRLLDRPAAALDHRMHKPLEAGARQLTIEVERLAAGNDQERKVNARRGAGRKLDLGEFCSLDQARRVGAHVETGLLLEAISQMVKDREVHVGAAELRVAAGGFDLEDALAELHNRHVESAASEIDHRDAQFLREAVEPVGERGCGWLVDQPRHLDAGDATGILRRTALVVVEVGRDGDDGLLYRLAQERLSVALDLLEQEGRELLG